MAHTWYHMVHVYVHVYHGTKLVVYLVPWYTCTILAYGTVMSLMLTTVRTYVPKKRKTFTLFYGYKAFGFVCSTQVPWGTNGTMVHVYVRTYGHTMVRYQCGMVPLVPLWYVLFEIMLYASSRFWDNVCTYRCTMARTIPGTMVYTCTYTVTDTCTNITLSQKRLEIQALRCNGETSGRCQPRRHHGILRFQHWYHMVCMYGTTLSQKRLEIQALIAMVHVYVPW
jgi:hypothetical protein